MKTAVRDAAQEYLLELKSKHSKLNNIENSYRMKTYLTSENLSHEEKLLLFKLRTRTFDCKTNYKNLYKNDLNCSVCTSEDSQEHLLSCKMITEGVDTENVVYSDLFASYPKQEKAIKVFMKLNRNRKLRSIFPGNQGSQAHLH